MNVIHKKRLYLLLFFTFIILLAVSLMLFAIRKNLNVFLTPHQVNSALITSQNHFRLGGLVKPHSLTHDPKGLSVSFIITDFQREINVHYTGILPDLFREGKGVIALGRLNAQGEFIADEVLAKHDENYMPKNVALALRENKNVKYNRE